MNEGGQVEAEYDEKHVELLGVGRGVARGGSNALGR
jgi:hypothetical protein